ncbi:MAG: hypothetical protein Tsb002_16460 [Wenzhouxiangellaceae bacterium]
MVIAMVIGTAAERTVMAIATDIVTATVMVIATIGATIAAAITAIATAMVTTIQVMPRPTRSAP